MDFISELKRVFKNYKREGKNVRVGPCPKPECSGSRTISVNIFGNKVPAGTFHCWECGWSGHWNVLAETMGLSKINNETDLTSNSERLLKYHSEKSSEIRKKIFNCKSWHGGWRGLEEDFIKSLKTQGIYDSVKIGTRTKIIKYLHFPVLVQGEEVGTITARYKKKKDQSRYKNSFGEWTRTLGLFPFDYVKSNIVVLVEGPFDALNLLSNGIPTMAFLGVENWKKGKISLLASKGIKYVIPLPDNDKAGKEIYDKMCTQLEKYFEVIYYEYESKDPGTMNEKEINSLKRLIDKYASNIELGYRK